MTTTQTNETCVHCGAEVLPPEQDDWIDAHSRYRSQGDWIHAHGRFRCQSPSVAYGHLAHPATVPCRADGPNPCLGAKVATTGDGGSVGA